MRLYKTWCRWYTNEKLASANKETYIRGNISVKNKNALESWVAAFVGEAAKKAANLNDGALIEITNGYIETVHNKDTKRNYVEVHIVDFNVIDETKFGKK